MVVALEKLGVERAGFVRALGLVFRTHGEDLPGIRGAQKDFSVDAARDSSDLSGAGFGELRKNAAAVDGEQRTAVASAGQKAAVT